MVTEIAVILALVLANGFFAGAEIAIVAVRKSRIEALAEEGRSGARAVLTLRLQAERFLATVQVGITVVSASAAAFGGASIASRIAPALAQVSWIGDRAEQVALGLVIAGVSYLSIVIGELVPKSLALRAAEPYALFVGRWLLGLSWLARPLVWLLSASANLVLRPWGDRTTFSETRHSVDELQDLVEQAAKAGTIHPEAGEIASRALELPDLTAADVMVPRLNTIMIPLGAPPEELRAILLEHTHTRFPVYEEHIDNIVGYVSVKDFLMLAWDRKLVVIQDILRPAFFVPESKLAVELLKEMRTRHTPFAIVVDEQGGTSGIVTMEDLIEELVGDIFSEDDRDAPAPIQWEQDGSVSVHGSTPVRELNRALGIELPEEGPWTTVAGLCLALSGRIPAAGDVLHVPKGISLEVLEASPRRVLSVRLRRPVEENPPSESTEE